MLTDRSTLGCLNFFNKDNNPLDINYISTVPVNNDINYISTVPVNNILHSLWRSIDVKRNGTLVGSANTDYMYKAMIDTLLGYSDSSKTKQLEMQGLHPCYENQCRS